MTNISASQVKELREKTGLGLMDCKKALEEANGDLESALDGFKKRMALFLKLIVGAFPVTPSPRSDYFKVIPKSPINRSPITT